MSGVATDPRRRVVASICGAAGSGKSHLAKTVVAALGDDRGLRVPTDYYLMPTTEPLAAYFARPLRYDWALLDRTLSLPEGTATSTPDFDFETFRRLAEVGGRPFVLRRILVTDGVYPYSSADVRILLTAPDDVRRKRIAERDEIWRTRVIDRWDHLELIRPFLESLAPTHDLELLSTGPLEQNADAVLTLLRNRFVLR
jgi:uridine kinase